ncbi:protein lap1 isoform X2 [Rhagoletis pomonella]|uniref:protein lap1 isoform X2 n=1 Tax=Rhagoletis pomonella TaxID=28610 RepID=UPI00177EB61B|nr:protein lap1 isoform X2 [Rhagoletis pomonella]
MAFLRCFSCLANQNDDIILELDFSNNILSDAFPNVWQHERTLEELYLNSARITSLPPELFYCQNLRVLVVSNNNLESVPNAVAALRQLQTLNLSRNYLSCNSLNRLPDALTSLITLKELFLNETYLEFLPANFGRLIHLKVLELRLNNLITLPKSIARLTSLLRLDIGYNEFTELPEVVGELKQLRELWIDFNQINRISSNVGKLRDILHFDASGNNISILPHDMSNWRDIEVLSLCTNNLDTFPFSIGSLKSLVTLKCASNELHQLPDSISNLDSLEELELSHNQLTSLPSTIGMLRKLRYLFVDDNDLHSLPNEICSCNDLRILSISRNKISELPKSIGRLSELKVLNIVNNHIATLPLSVLNLINLSSLWISDNQSQPLVPLQYLDINTRSKLTCFMLPQAGSCMYPLHFERRSPAHLKESDTYERPSENSDYDCPNQIEPLATNTYPIRRICFAEKAIIMSTSPNSKLYNFQFACETDNNPKIETVQNINKNSLTNNNKADGGIRLMRSPTPYPKELRLFAKYIRNERRSFGSEPLRVKEARVLFNVDKCHSNIITRNMNTDMPTNTDDFSLQADKINDALHQISHDINNLTHSEQICEIDTNSPLQQGSSYPASLFELRSQSPLISNRNEVDTSVSVTPPLIPPTFHIARVFTRKTAHDLTNYEMIRCQQQLNLDNLNENEAKGVEKLPKIEMLNEKRADGDKNSDIQDLRFNENDSNNSICSNTELLDTAECIQRRNAHELKGLDKLAKHHNDYGLLNYSLPYPSGDEETNSFIPTTESITAINYRNTNITLQKCSVKKTPWFFGAHKNPTVIQVSLKWNNNVGFDIEGMPHKEGIYVAATAPNSNAARVLCASDKLLEIDGHDLTNLSILEAKAIISSAGPTMHIMLSRK